MAIGAGANVLGGLMQSVAATMANKAQSDEFAREIQRQQRYRNEAFGTFQPSLITRGVETARDQIGEGSQKRQDFYGKVGETKLGIGGGPNERDKQLYGLLGKGRADLGGYSDWALNQMVSNIRTQDELNRISNFAGGTAQVFPYKMEEAGHAGDELAFWGSLIASLGGGAGSFVKSGAQAGPAWSSQYPGAGGQPYESRYNPYTGGGYSAPKVNWEAVYQGGTGNE